MATISKSPLFFALLLYSLSCLAGLRVEIQPSPVFVGETAQLQLISDDESPRLTGKPPQIAGLQWTGGPYQQQSTQIVNFKRTFTATTTYQFTVSRTGSFTLPPLEVRLGNKTVRTQSTVFLATERTVANSSGHQLTYDDLVFGEITVGKAGSPPAKLYIGQEVPVRITIFVHEQLFSNMGYPTVDIPNASFRDYSAQNPQSPHFLPTKSTRQRRENMTFIVVPFDCMLSPKTPGALSGTISVNCHLNDPDRGRSSRRSPFDMFDDDFFASRRKVQRTLRLDFPEITALPLPAPPASDTFLGLVGQWNVAMTLKPASVRVGEPVTLTAEITGTGNSDLFAPPKLDCPGFRIFDPEFKKDSAPGQTSAQITWVMLPLGKDSRLPEVAFTSFDPAKETYIRHSLTDKLTVLPPQLPETGAIIADNSLAPLDEQRSRQSDQAAVDILYIKTNLSPATKRPLWLNVWKPTLLLLLLSPSTSLLCSSLARRRDRLSGDRSYRRRQAALKQKNRLLRQLRGCPREQLPSLIREQLVPYLTDLIGLPPGTSAPATAGHLETLDQQELADAIRQAEQAGFMPGAVQGIDTAKLTKLLAKLTAAISVTLILLYPNAHAQSTEPATVLQQAREAYDRGDVEGADNLYESLQSQNGENVALLYNRANCAFRLGNPGLAMAYYERARRLAPRDSDIRENLNFVRRQLDLPPVLPTRTPTELLVRLRDHFRPDEWLLASAIVLFGWSLGSGLLRLRGRPATWLHFAAGLTLIVCLLAAWSQSQSSYRTGAQALVVDKHAKLFSLPGGEGKELDLPVALGDQVHVVETRTDSARVRTGGAEGWIDRSQIRLIW